MSTSRPTILKTPTQACPWPLAVSARSAWTGVALAVVFAGLTAVGAHVRIPLEPVPITLQTLFVLLSGAVAGPAWGLLGQSAYLFGGVLGVPLFAGSVTGLAVLSGPTGGYLLGFVAAAYLIGKLIGRRTGYRWTLFVFSLGSLAILSLGALHLCLFAGGDVSAALRMGVLPFLAGDAAKTMAAASMYESYRRLRSPRRAR